MKMVFRTYTILAVEQVWAVRHTVQEHMNTMLMSHNGQMTSKQ